MRPRSAPHDDASVLGSTVPSASLTRALLEVARPGELDEDLQGLDVVLEQRGLQVQTFLTKDLSRARVALSRQTLVAGRLGAVESALRQLGVEIPRPDDYPAAARPWFGREIWPSTLGAARARVEDRGEALFIKPRARAKRFTGRVFDTADDFRGLAVASARAEVWCAEVVDVVTEHRAFVVDDRVVGLRHYGGDGEVEPDPGVVHDVLTALAGGLPAGCALDFAVLGDGRTVLLEANDGYALGRYGLEGEAYADLLLARWSQLVGTSR